ncbi:uncharacterized protein K452DRAFT_323058 [Aplosporella prunicola CBS 121167]|uniref:Uncharacterized protein n=1 Tax=Aplosporella prunicola CBS 121167 TaxID=1176127 RepID=A0A6A6ATU5_9PEZI|nr:uncharacterized protein K452DRAFT_323058 [Aplosporella prunicola CBS 121167]KAF2135432.1 hypothetical protein K452DRAFT_323058 [Aplosporella prunicola CBS 121167]
MKRKTLRTVGIMKTRCSWLMLLLVGLYGVAAKEVLDATRVDSNGDDRILTPQNNRNGWVNPEDLTPMPQCIAQQDPSYWLSTMSTCTGKRCTRHFGAICTHHQWLIQTSCLSTAFSSDVVKTYFPYCSRSILAKAQLYQWIRGVTGRTWLVDIGDANELQDLSPASLDKGYAAVSVEQSAPTCLTGSVSDLTMEPFQHVLASCSFTSTTQHTGRADRPWEYREGLKSMVALDFETVGYNLTGSSIEYGYYFDKECFCRTFTINPEEICPRSERLEWTQEHLWVRATCGPTSLPSNWTDSLKVTGFDYVPIEDWHWPTFVMDIGKRVTGLVQHCATDACGIDSSGYCKVKRTVSRTCICHNMSFETCGGSCQDFETRINYVNWLHDLCGHVQDWRGLPDNWLHMAAPTALDMIPWQWTIKPSDNWSKCPLNIWKIGSFVLVNVATFLVAVYGRGAEIHGLAPRFPRLPYPSSWFAKGILIAALQLLANLVNASLLQATMGYDDIPVIQLMFLWCSMPRPAWMASLLIGLQPFDTIDFSVAKSSLFAEIILQTLSAYYMVLTVNYGLKHNFYFRSLKGAERGQSARLMYTGALLWIMVTTVALFWLIRATRRMNSVPGSGSDNVLKRQGSIRTMSKIAEKLMAKVDNLCIWLGEELENYWMEKSKFRGMRETSPFISRERNYATMHRSLPVRGRDHSKELAKIYVVTTMSMALLWFTQWIFWIGFIGLSSQEFCISRLELLTAVGTFFSLTSTALSLAGPKVVPSWKAAETS